MDKKNGSDSNGQSELHQVLEQLSGVDVTLSAHADLNSLLQDSLYQARKFCHADAGSLYMRYGDILVFEIVQCDTLAREKRLEVFKSFKNFHFPIDKTSLVGFCVMELRTLIIDDVQGSAYFNAEIDKTVGYTTTTMVALPLINDEGEAIGCMQLINALSKEGENIGQVVPFDRAKIENLETMAANIAATIQTMKEKED
ncbi:GAF domain-containing protein [Candidatus Riflebacteria bacterium]